MSGTYAPKRYRVPAKRSIAQGLRKPGVMNGTEAKYAEHLEARKSAGEIVWFRYEGVRLKLAPMTTYCPDFFVMLANNEMECHEVKGHFTPEAKAKVKVAADAYPFRFFIVRALPKRDGGGWNLEEV